MLTLPASNLSSSTDMRETIANPNPGNQNSLKYKTPFVIQ